MNLKKREKDLSEFGNMVVNGFGVMKMSQERNRKLEKEGCKHILPTDMIGTPEQIAKAVHQTLDWVRACKARSDDGRGFDTEAILAKCQKGFELTKYFPKHYEEDPR